MMPLKLASNGEELTICKITGLPSVKAHLADLGFVVGAIITIVSSANGNLIVNIKGSKIAIGEEMAMRIFV